MPFRAWLLERPSGPDQSHFDIDGISSNKHTNKPHYVLSRLMIRFKASLTQSVSIICYAKYDSTIKVDKTRNVELLDKPILNEHKAIQH